MKAKWIILGMAVPVLMGAKEFKNGPGYPVGSKVDTITRTIDISVSAQWIDKAINMDGYNLMSIQTDANFDTSNIEVHCASSEDTFDQTPKGTYVALTQDDGSTAVVVTSAAASKVYAFTGANAAAVASCRYIRLKATTSQTTQDSVLQITLKG